MLVNQSKKTGYGRKISEIENKITGEHDYDKYVTAQEFDEFTLENFTARLAQVNLASKNDIVSFVKKTDFDNTLKKLTSNKLNYLHKDQMIIH